MHKIIFAAFLLLFASCQESLEDRCEREAREFTKKNCPITFKQNLTLDSMMFNKNTLTLNHHYTIAGVLDDPEAIAKTDARDELLKQLRNTTSLKTYKDVGYNFSYIYWSASKKGTKVAEYTFTPKEYK